MTTLPSTPAADLKDEARSAARQAKPTLVRLVRLGYAAKGVVYLMIGLLAALAALGRGGQTTGSRGALATILGQPFGRTLLTAVAVGLGVYALWQFFRATTDPEHAGRRGDRKSIGRRVAYAVSGLIHVGLVVAAVRLLSVAGGSGADDNASARGWTASLMAYPLGRWMVGAVGLGFVAFGLYQLYRAYRADLDKQLELGRLGDRGRTLARWAGRLGIAARGVVFGIVGGFLLAAAAHADPNEAKGLGGALDAVHGQTHGRWLLGVVAAGLAAYGVYLFVRARYRRVELE